MPLSSRFQHRFQPTTPMRQLARIRSLARDLGRILHRLDWSTLDTATRQRLALFLLPLHSALSLTGQITRPPQNKTGGKKGARVAARQGPDALSASDEPLLSDDLPIFRRPRDP